MFKKIIVAGMVSVFVLVSVICVSQAVSDQYPDHTACNNSCYGAIKVSFASEYSGAPAFYKTKATTGNKWGWTLCGGEAFPNASTYVHRMDGYLYGQEAKARVTGVQAVDLSKGYTDTGDPYWFLSGKAVKGQHYKPVVRSAEPGWHHVYFNIW